MKYITFILMLTGIIFQLERCDIINPKEEIPGYIHIDSFTLTGNYDSVGSLSHRITDAWVYVDNDFIGTFEMPATFPVLKNGPHLVWIRAGVYENGISLTRDQYPFYDTFATNINFEEKKTYTINPKTKYVKKGINFKFKEDFESSKSVFKKSELSLVDMERTDSTGGVFEGNYSLKATLDSSNRSFFQMETQEYYNLPRQKANFLELNYKSDISILVGYIVLDPYSGDQNQHVVLTLNPSATWKKIYVNYGMEVDFEQSQKIFKIFIGTAKGSGGGTSSIYLDNIKLISFE